MPGQLMNTEMRDQPEVLRRLLERRADTVARVAAVAPRRLAGVLLMARGSSDHAALHARYLLELATGRPAALGAPSLWTRYGVSTSLTNWVVVAISQSGRTAEIIDTVERTRAAGAVVVSVTNAEDGELAGASDVVVPLLAGEEVAVPATKTVTSSLLALAHVAAGLGRLPWQPGVEERLPEAVAEVLDDERAMRDVLHTVGERETVHVGRGFTLPVALEAALKVKETTTHGSRGYATGDFLHGPIAAVGHGSAVLGYAAAGPCHADVVEVLSTVRRRGVPVALVADQPPARTQAEGLTWVPVPAGLPEPLTAITLTVRAQQFAYHATMRAGLDPDQPEGLNKVTITH